VRVRPWRAIIGTVPSDVASELRRALAAETRVDLALLFGSRTTGRHRPDSDVDLAVRAAGADTLDLARRLSLALGAEADVVDLDSVGYPMLRELVAHGVVVAERVPGAAARWRSHALATLDTDRVWFERMRDAYLARVAHGASNRLLNADLVVAKLAELGERIARARSHCPATLEELARDRDALDVVAFNLMLAVQSCLDVASHVIADEGWPPATTLASAFVSLHDHDVLKRETADALGRAAGLRNASR
jgi:uncharacterized protein YutE (UPF0331/DUF86 family)/predicted nucleotidyltransferase